MRQGQVCTAEGATVHDNGAAAQGVGIVHHHGATLNGGAPCVAVGLVDGEGAQAVHRQGGVSGYDAGSAGGQGGVFRSQNGDGTGGDGLGNGDVSPLQNDVIAIGEGNVLPLRVPGGTRGTDGPDARAGVPDEDIFLKDDGEFERVVRIIQQKAVGGARVTARGDGEEIQINGLSAVGQQGVGAAVVAAEGRHINDRALRARCNRCGGGKSCRGVKLQRAAIQQQGAGDGGRPLHGDCASGGGGDMSLIHGGVCQCQCAGSWQAEMLVGHLRA